MIALARHYPLAIIAAAGIAAGFGVLPAHHLAAEYLFAIVAIGGGVPLVISTARNMLAGRFYVDTVAALAIVGSVAMGEYMAGALVVLMQAGGEALEDYGLRRANRSLDNLLRRAPSVAHVKRGDDYVELHAADIAVGDMVLVRPSDIIAIDGIVVDGQGGVDESALTGEPVPLPKLPGDHVFSGTINLSGSFHVRATSTAAQSKYELIVRMVQRAQGERAPINRLANRFTPGFTLLTIAVAAGALLITHDRTRSLAVLVVATPCPLIIATPLAVLSAINRAAALNIIVKSGAAVEQAGMVDTVVFDKTGTLTSGRPELSEVRVFGPGPQWDSGTERQWENGMLSPCLSVPLSHSSEVLRLAAAVELLSPHVLASTVVRAAREQKLPLVPAADVAEQPGAGVAGTVEGHRVAIGSASYLESIGVRIENSIRSERASLSRYGRTIALVAMDGALVAMLVFQDKLRPEAPELMRRLHEMGIRRTVMLTGDSEETARAVAAEIGIDDVRARMQPEEKLGVVRALGDAGTVMMVGDGINDAPALATAGVGVAMGGYGAGIATDAADMVITVENVERVADGIEIGRRMVTVAKQGIYFGIGASVLLMALATFGLFPPAVGALLQELLDLATILNALRAR